MLIHCAFTESNNSCWSNSSRLNRGLLWGSGVPTFQVLQHCSGNIIQLKGLVCWYGSFHTIAAFSTVRRSHAVPQRSRAFLAFHHPMRVVSPAGTQTNLRAGALNAQRDSSLLSERYPDISLSFQMSTRKQFRQPLRNIKKGKWQSPCPQNDVHWWCKHQWMPTHLQVSISVYFMRILKMVLSAAMN